MLDALRACVSVLEGRSRVAPFPSQFKQMVWICHGCELAKDVNFVGV